MKTKVLVLILQGIAVVICPDSSAQEASISIEGLGADQALLDVIRSTGGLPYRLQHSPDLAHWFPLGEAVPEDGSVVVDLAGAAEGFYRLAEFQKKEVPVLVILPDFQDTSFRFSL